MPWEVRKSLFSYLKKHKNIKGVIDETTCTSSLLLYGYSDIVLWPAEIEGFGLVGIESIYMGTPVVAYDIPPMSNIITNGVNGMLVPCDDGGSKGGVMYAEPNPSEFIKVATDAINEKILALNKNTKVGRRSVRSMFYSQWKKLIEG
jgi:glycosyltransferase involved in cell wall biosynthesis